jgi:flagellar protein FlbD
MAHPLHLRAPMLKLTRLNHQTVAINPDHIAWVEAHPDTTLCLLGGERILVRESLEELIERIVEFRRTVRAGLRGPAWSEPDGEPLRIVTDAPSTISGRGTQPPSGVRGSAPPKGGSQGLAKVASIVPRRGDR